MGVYGFNDDKTKADISALSEWVFLGYNTGEWTTGVESIKTTIGNLEDIVRDYEKVILVIGRKTSSNYMAIAGQVEYPTRLLKARGGTIDETKGETWRLSVPAFEYISSRMYYINAALQVWNDGIVKLYRDCDTVDGINTNLKSSNAYLFGIRRI